MFVKKVAKLSAVIDVVGGGEGGQRRELNVLKRLRISGALLILLWITIKKITVSILIYVKIKCIPVIKAEFSASLLQCSVSHDPSEILLICCFIIIFANRCAA